MKKLILVLAIALIATQAFGELTVTLSKRTGQDIVDINYSGADPCNLPRAFALDVNITGGAKFTDINDYMIGESNESIRGYGIYPAQITFYTAADEVEDPQHREGNVSSWGSPLAAQGDIGAEDQNFPSKHVILEFASLYKTPDTGGPNCPETSGRLCSLTVDCNGATVGVNVKAVEEDTYRGGIVLEDSNAIELSITPLPWTCASPPEKATTPISPTDTATCVSLNPTLTWTAGDGATSHDVYFGTVDPPGVPEFQGNQPGASYVAGPLDNDETYYWRIDEKNDAGTTTGDVWSFTTENAAPGMATNTAPANGATGVSTAGTDLTWTAGANATNHIVYFGTDSTPPKVGIVAMPTVIYPTGALTINKKYYWHVDANNTGCHDPCVGDTWVFDTNCLYVGKTFDKAFCDPALNANIVVTQTMVNIWNTSYVNRAKCWCCNGQKCGNGIYTPVASLSKVDVSDLAKVKKAYNKLYNQVGYVACVDFNLSTKVDITDLSILKKHYNKTVSSSGCL